MRGGGVRRENEAVKYCDLNLQVYHIYLYPQVCQQLGIIELDYFGLQYTGEKGEQLWLNLRNDLTRQLMHSPPYRFRLRVKFFVEPHFILQETTRWGPFLYLALGSSIIIVNIIKSVHRVHFLGTPSLPKEYFGNVDF